MTKKQRQGLVGIIVASSALVFLAWCQNGNANMGPQNPPPQHRWDFGSWNWGSGGMHRWNRGPWNVTPSQSNPAPGNQ